MKYQIKATAPTIYQLNSLSAFNMYRKHNGNGSFSASIEFETQEEAKQYLRSRAEKYNDEDPHGSPSKLSDMYAGIEHGSLTLDAVTAYIEEVAEEVEG